MVSIFRPSEPGHRHGIPESGDTPEELDLLLLAGGGF
jgi:hypothetical protein